MGRFFRITAGITGTILFLLITALLISTAIGVRIDLSFLKPGVESSLEKLLGRNVSIDGPVEFELSFWPALNLSGFSIDNLPHARSPKFVEAGEVQLKLAIPPLLEGDLVIQHIIARQVAVNLETDAAGNSNWVFTDAAAEPEDSGPTEDTRAQDEQGRALVTFSGLDYLSLQGISINYFDAVVNKTVAFTLEEMSGTAAAGEPIALDFAGNLQGKPYELSLTGSSISELVDKDQPWSFEVNGEVLNRKMLAKGDLLLQSAEPEIKLAFGIRDVDVGAILEALGLVEGMSASFGDAGFKLALKGTNLHEVLQQSSMGFAVRGGSWLVQLPNSDAAFAIDDLYGNIRVDEGNDVQMDLKGTIDGTPVDLHIKGAPLVEYVHDQKEIPLAIDARLLDSRIRFAGVVKLPLTQKDIALALKVDSEQIDRFNELLRLDLPPLGPVALESSLQITETGYDLGTLKLQIGDSDLDGAANLDLSGEKPRIEATLVSSLIQIDDFDRGDTPAEDAGSAPEDDVNKDEGGQEVSEEEAAQRQEELKTLLSYETLNAFDASLQVEAREVRSGQDTLGAARLQAELKDARLTVHPLIVDLPGGSIELNGDYQPSPSDVAVNLNAQIERFDAGILVRRARPESDMGGAFTLDANLHSRAPELSAVMEHASGHIDFALVPENFSSGVIDLWAVNLLSALIDKSTEEDDSVVNCMVMRFGIEQGLMTEKAIFMDTTNMQVSGQSEIDFRSRELNITMAPESKRPEYYSMAVPVRVTGSFDDFGVGLSAARTAKQVIEFITSPLHVPIRRAIEEEIPADGAAACKAAWENEPDEEEADTLH